MGQINTNNYPTVSSLADADLLIVENATNGTGTTTPKQLRENAIGTDTLHTSAQSVTGAINELKGEIDAGAGVVCYDVDTITSGYLGGQFSGSANLLLLHLTTDGTADATNGYMMMLSYSRPVARFAYGRLVDSDGVAYKQDVYADNTIICTISGSGEGTESDPEQVVILGIINAGFMLTPTAVVSDRDIIDGQGNTLSVLAEALTKTASGNPVVITDCAGGKARSLKTTIEAIQDLHGYDHPWAGGAGKNKLEQVLADLKTNNTDGTWAGNVYTINGGTIEVLTDNGGNVIGMKADGTFTDTAVFYINVNSAIAAGGYLLSGCPSGGGSGTYKLDIPNASYVTDSGSGVFFTADGTTIYNARLVVYAGTYANKVFQPMISISTESATFAPYSNECPISGRTESTVNSNNKNLLRVTAQSTTISGVTITVYDDGTVKLNGTATAQIIFVLNTFTFLDGVSYTLNGAPTGSEFGKYFLSCVIGADYGSGATFTGDGLTNNVRIVVQNGIACNNIIFNPMIRLASDTDPTFVPYAHSSATIQLGQTVYGADINWGTGVMTIDRAYVKAKDLTWRIQSSAYARFTTDSLIDTIKKSNTDYICISDSYESRSNQDSLTNYNQIYSNVSGDVKIGDVEYASSTIEQWLATRGETEIVYKLATPTTLQLTATQLQMLKGYNRVTIDNGSIELGYIAKLT